MKYTKEQRLDIGRRIYDGEIDCYQAAEEYTCKSVLTPLAANSQASLQEYQEMTKEELIQALIQARITEARLKKGYEVKGDGSIIQYSNKNTK